MHSTKAKGYILGAVAAASYGLNPLFALPLYAEHLSVTSVLFYRFSIAFAILGIIMAVRGMSFRLTKKEVLPVIAMGLCNTFSAMLLFIGYNYMGSGIASTILFVYPIIVALIMGLFFHERLSAVAWVALFVAFLGIACLGKTSSGEILSVTGTMFVLGSALAYALYMVGVNRSVLKTMSPFKLNFYVMVVCTIFFSLRGMMTTGIELPQSGLGWTCAVGLAIFPTIISLLTLTAAIHYVGSTITAILGALEPLTALFFGVLVFGEEVTALNTLGILLVILAVTAIVCEGTITKFIKTKILSR